VKLMYDLAPSNFSVQHQKSSSEELNSFQQAITDLLSTSTSNLLTRLDHLDSTGDQIVSSSLSTSSSISSLRNNYDHLVSSLLKTENILSEQATSLETLKTSQLESTSQLSNLISGLTEFINHTDWNSRSRSGNNWNENISLKSFGMMSLRVLGFVESENSIGFRDQGFEVESWVGKVLLMIVECELMGEFSYLLRILFLTFLNSPFSRSRNWTTRSGMQDCTAHKVVRIPS